MREVTQQSCLGTGTEPNLYRRFEWCSSARHGSLKKPVLIAGGSDGYVNVLLRRTRADDNFTTTWIGEACGWGGDDGGSCQSDVHSLPRTCVVSPFDHKAKRRLGKRSSLSPTCGKEPVKLDTLHQGICCQHVMGRPIDLSRFHRGKALPVQAPQGNYPIVGV